MGVVRPFNVKEAFMKMTDCGVVAERWGQLSLSLAFAPDPEVASPRRRSAVATLEAVTWTEEEVVTLREGILVNALTSLAKGHMKSEARRELMEWLDSEELEPFSFNVCALNTGRDPEILRAAIHRIMEKEIEKNATQKLVA